MLPLLGVAVVVLGFAARVNPLLVVMTAAIVSGLAGGLDLVGVLSAFGKAFNENRYISVVWLVLPAIGALERAGLQQRVRDLIAGLRAMTLFRLLTVYFLIRQAGAALGFASIGGPATLVRPLVAPMAEATAEARLGPLPKHVCERIAAQVAATDNVAIFFGEDIFVAIGSILLIKGVLEQNGIIVEPLQLSVWAIPTAVAAFAIHAIRLFLFDRQLSRQAGVPTKEKARA
jgi:uncharacterized membrane protein